MATQSIDREARRQYAGRVRSNQIIVMLGKLLGALEDDLARLTTGGQGDTDDERAARAEVYDRTFAARERVIESIGELQRVDHPELLFGLGVVSWTPGFERVCGQDDREADIVAADLIYRQHGRGHWGQLSDHDARVNASAMGHGERIMSCYMVSGEKVWVITEGDRSRTTVLLAEEY